MNLDPITRTALEGLYITLLSVVVQLAKVLGKPCPIQTRADRRSEHTSSIQGLAK